MSTPIANVNAPRGFIPYRQGGKAQGKVIRRQVATTSGALAIGDVYEIYVDGTVARTAINRAVGGNSIVGFGVCIGIDLHALAGPIGPMSDDYVPATPVAGYYVLGLEDPDVEFDAQTGGAAFAEATMIGGTYDVGDTAPNTTLAQSRQVLDVSESGTQFKVIELTPSPCDNSDGLYAHVVVRLAVPI